MTIQLISAAIALLPAWTMAQVAPAPLVQPATDAAVAEQVRRLESNSDKTARLEALRWLGGNSGDKKVAAAIPALERCLRTDPDAKLRERAAGVLCEITRRLNLPCSTALLEALHRSGR